MIVIKTRSLSRALRTSGQLLSKPFATATALALIAIAAPATSSRAQTATAPAQADAVVQLDHYVVSASRTSQDIALIPTSVTSLALSEMARLQIADLRDALRHVPGVNIAETGGATGSKSSIFIRGAGTNQTLLIIDGVRMNSEDWTSSYSGFLGGAGLAGLDRVEILRGPQSTLYGSAAMGGVVSLETARGRGAPHGLVSLDAGSFNTIGASAAIAGSAPVTSPLSPRPQSLSYSAALSASYSENDRDNNAFKQLGGSTRLEYKLAGALTAGFTYRGNETRYEEPGPTHSPSDAGILATAVNIATAYAAWTPADTFTSRLTCGWIQNIYDWDSSYPSHAHSTRNVLDWQNNWKPLSTLELVAGLNTEWSRYDSGSAAESDRLASLYVNAVYTPLKNLDITAGVRADDYSTLDTHATWRAGAAHRIQKTNTTLRATIGTGFNAPAPQYVLGGGWYAPSPDLKPEESTGWDIGFEQDIVREKITLGAAYFRNDFDNKFTAAPSGFLYKYGNIPGATTKGVETYLYASPLANLRTQLTYTYLDARDSRGARLILMPRHTLSADANYQFTKELLVGAGLTCIAGRPDEAYTTYDPNTWAATRVVEKMGDYAVVRAYASYELACGVKLKLRAENLLDKKYENIAGYPALPLGVFGGIEWKF